MNCSLQLFSNVTEMARGKLNTSKTASVSQSIFPRYKDRDMDSTEMSLNQLINCISICSLPFLLIGLLLGSRETQTYFVSLLWIKD